ncbi:protein kinase, putative [Leishmania tarentolae]|uniref:mitogen-activated protein kinase kinase n=1 Tax=Leishmania tarentolae TaxID=5689 RepID=A0A640KSI5_LEITA|nr:protein kinase, putative [Leishmania tarentolae]
MQEEKHLCTLRDVRGEPPSSSNACLDLYPSLSKNGLPYTVEPPSAEAREEDGSQNVVPTKDVASSTRVAAPLMMDPVTGDATGVSSAPQQPPPSILVATPPLFGSVAAPQCAEMKTAVYSAVSNQLGTEEEMQNLRSGTDAASTHVSIVDINGNAGETVTSLPSVGEGAHRVENGRSRRKLCKPEVSFLQETVTAPGAGAAPSAAMPGANHSVVSGEGHLRSSHTGFGKANGAGSVTLSGAGGCLLPADGTRGHLARGTSACSNYQASSSANEGKRFDGTETVAGTLGSEKPLLPSILSADHLNRSPPPKSGSGAARRLVSLSSNAHSDTHRVDQHHYTADASTTNTCRPERRPDTTAAATEPCSCRVPVSVALVINTVITVILVASLTIVPLNSVSTHLLDYVMSTLSLSLASSYTRSVEATMRFLPNAINAYAFSYMNSSDTQAWNWTAADMPQALRQMCQAVTGTYRNPTSFLLYMSLSSPYTGYSAYCSQQYSDDDLIGNYIIDNSSQPRYFINTTTYNYAEPLTVYPAVQAMTPWEYTVDFGATKNPWHTIVMPWYEHYQKSRRPRATAGPAVVPGAAFEVDRIFSEESEFPFPNSPKGLNGHWRVFIGNVSVITYTLPFVDYAGNPASIMGALSPDGFNALHQNGVIAAGSNARAMVVDTTSGLVFITSWDQNTTVRLDNWSTSCNCTPGGSDQRAVYLEDITDPLMMAAVQYIGGREAIANTPLEVNRWSGQFTHNGSQNLMVINRVNISSDYSGMHLVVIYIMCKDDFTSFITHLQVITLVAVALVLVVIALVEVALMYLLVQPVRGVAAGLRAAAQLRNGKEFVEHATSVIKEIAEMQRDFHIMNTKLMQMKTFLPQGMLGGTTVSSDIQGFSDGDLVTFAISALHGKGEGGVWEKAHGDDGYGEACDVLGGDGSGDVCAAQRCIKDSYSDVGSLLCESEAGRQRRQSCIPPVAEVTHLRLNDRVLLEEVNHFHRRYCSTIVFCMHLMEEEISVRFLNQNCVYFAEGVLPCVLRYGGVVELQRPDYIVVSFGAHNKVALHQNRAAMCALEVMQVLNATTPIGPRVGCLIDASEYYVGTCGAVDRNALVTFSNNLVPKGDLIRVLKSVQTQIVLTQRLASTLESSMLVMPVDCMVLNPLSMKQIILYELRGHVRMLPSKVSVAMVRKVIRAVRMGFTHMLKGDYGKALEILAPFEIMELQAARLGFMCRVLVSRHINRPFVRSVTRLTFSEAHFAGYDEGCPTRWGESHESGTPFGVHGHQGVTEGLMNTANPLTAGGGAYSFPFSPFNNDLDPAILLMTPTPPMRLVVGAPLNPPSVKKGDCQRINSGSVTVATASASTCANEGSQTRHGSSRITGGKPEQNGLERVTAAHAAADEGETALFEIFVDAQLDDDDDVDDREAEVEVGGNRAGSRAYHSACNEVTNNGRFGSGEMPAEECTAASMIAGKVMHSRCKNELPLVFTDYEGNTWRRSYDILGTGAFSTVHRGLSMTGNLVALKCFQMGARNIQVHAIVDEVRLFAKLHHENVAQYLSLYVSETYVIEIMELVPGGSLDTLLTSFGSLRPESVRRYLRDIVRGLSYLHTANIVHCDIKPHNVLLAMDGQCKLSDFGSAIARATSSICSFDNVLELRGTPGYMAPEVARGDVPTMKSDVYSLGITVLELLTGKLPWEYADAFTPKLPGKLTRHKSDSEHAASQLQTCATFPLSDARVADSAVSQAGAHSSENPLNAGSASAQVPLGEPNTDTRLYATTMLSNSSCTGPATSIDETVCGGGSVLSPQSQSSKAAHTLRCLELNSNSVGMAKDSSAPPPCALESTQEERASATATSLKAATAPDLAHFQVSGTHSTLLEKLSAAKNAKADACAEDGSHMPLSGALGRSSEIGQSRQKHNNTSYSPSFASQRSSSTLLPPLPQTPHLAPSPQRRSLEQVLRSPTQLVVHIGRGLVVPRIPDTLDEDVRNFLELCLKPDPAERASISELMLHPWLM